MTPMTTRHASPTLLIYRQSILSLAKVVGLLLTYTLQAVSASASSFSTLPAAHSPTPVQTSTHHKATSKPHHVHHTGHTSLDILKSHAEIDDTPVWLYFFVAAMLVLLGGAFAGLTIALMGQDEIYLQVIATSEEGLEKKHASKVLRLLKKGKHWVLVTLLLSNVITNETLPIVLDRSLGGGWPAVLGSTVAIVIFGEIIPQSICVRYGLSIGAYCAPFVLALMYLMGPVAWPIAKLLDKLLGEEHGTTYKKAGLKTLVTLHRSLGEAGERLNADEVTIISAVLDLKNKPVGNIMTPIEDVFTMSEDTILDEKTMEMILSAGYSRIPIHRPESPTDFVGMLLVKALIVYDPEDAKPVRDFALATLPETFPETSCLDIVNFFQEGKSHMVLVSESPGDTTGALGVVTLEDVIEELIGEEIIDESDVFIDVHKAIRRMAPAPRLRLPKRTAEVGTNEEETQALLIDIDDNTEGGDARRNSVARNLTFSGDTKPPGGARYSLDASRPQFRGYYSTRRSSSTTGRADDAMSKRSGSIDVRERLRHLGPSNKASDPKTTKYANVKIKPGTGTARNSIEPRRLSMALSDAGVGMSAGLGASDGVQAVQNATLISPIDDKPTNLMDSIQTLPVNASPPARLQEEAIDVSGSPVESTVGSLPSNSRWGNKTAEDRSRSRGVARSGSITENIVEHDGVRKVVLQTCCSESDEDEELSKEETEAMRDARDRLGDEGVKASHRSHSHSHHAHEKSKKHHHHYTTVDADSRSHSHSHSHSHHNGHTSHSHSHSNGHAKHRSKHHKHDDEDEHAVKDEDGAGERKKNRRKHRSKENGHEDKKEDAEE